MSFVWSFVVPLGQPVPTIPETKYEGRYELLAKRICKQVLYVNMQDELSRMLGIPLGIYE